VRLCFRASKKDRKETLLVILSLINKIREGGNSREFGVICDINRDIGEANPVDSKQDSQDLEQRNHQIMKQR
jgi:hypothetical protein